MGRMLNRARQAAQSGGNGGAGGGGRGKPPNVGALLGGSGAMLALIGGGLALNASLYNVGPFHFVPLLVLFLF